MENTVTFLYSCEPDKTKQKEIIVEAKNSAEAYAIFIRGLVRSASFVYDKTNKRRII